MQKELEKETGPASDATSAAGSVAPDAELRDSSRGRQHVDRVKTQDVEKADLPPAKKLASMNDVKSIPNGGVMAWLQVVGSFFLFFNTWGLINTFGQFQAIYQTSLLPDVSPSAISWVGSIQAFLLLFIGTLTGPIYDAGYFRALLLTGTILASFGMMMLSLCTQYWQVMLAQALCIGLGCGCLFVPSVAILSSYFTTHYGLAVGISASGSSFGGLIYPIVLHRLEPKIGFPWATRVLGFMIFGTLLVPLLVMKVRALPSQKRGLLDLPAFKHAPFSLFTLGLTLGFCGLYVPFFYTEVFAIQEHITDPNFAFYTLSILNAGSTFGRIIPNYIADIVGPFNVIIPCTLSFAILILCLQVVKSAGPLIVFCILYGFFSGCFVSTPPAVVVTLTPNRALIGTHMGMAFTIVSLGILIGGPSAGAILRQGGFNAIWIFGGVFALAGVAIMSAARLIKTGWTNIFVRA